MSRFRDRFYRPDIWSILLASTPGKRLELADKASRKSIKGDL
ncbi:hypothetical protein [Hyphomicrobium sp. 2TAF46]